MSAFIVGKAHIDALVQAGLTFSRHDRMRWYLPASGTQRCYRELDHTTANAVGKMLWAENIASVRHRYPDVSATLEDAPGPVGLTPFEVNGYTFPVFSARKLSAVETLKAVACYEYQSCEHPEWETSEAKAFCEALTSQAIHSLPGYDDAAWAVA